MEILNALMAMLCGNKHVSVSDCTLYSFYGLKLEPEKNKAKVKLQFHSYNTYFEDMEALQKSIDN